MKLVAWEGSPSKRRKTLISNPGRWPLVSLGRQPSRGRNPNIKPTGPPGWGLGWGLITPSCKKMLIKETETETSNSEVTAPDGAVSENLIAQLDLRTRQRMTPKLSTLTTENSSTILDKMNGTFRPPLSPISMMLNWRVLVFARLHHCFGGGGGGKGVNCSFLFCPRLQSWTKWMEHFDHPSPTRYFNDAKMVGFGLRATSSLLWGKGFNCSFLFCPRL